MKSIKDGYGYNERLFSGGLRGKLHLARFHWFLSAVKSQNCRTDSVLELGCFDGKLLDYISNKPLRYVGFDANWEGGLDIAKEKWANDTNYLFFKATAPDDIHLDRSDMFNIGVAMETLEHVPPQLVDGFIRKIAQHVDGYFFVTVPNEKGVFFLVKWLFKKLFSKDADTYTLTELVNATLGRMERVSRQDHKGFDYKKLIVEIEKYFDVRAVSGFPFRFLPCWLCFSIGIVAKTNPRKRGAVCQNARLS